MENGEAVVIRALWAPVVNRAEGVCLWVEGETATVAWSGFWAGLLERGAITLAAREGSAGDEKGDPGAGAGGDPGGAGADRATAAEAARRATNAGAEGEPRQPGLFPARARRKGKVD